MYQDYKGFIHADLNGHSNGGGYFSLEEYAKTKISNFKYSEFIGINCEISKNGEFTNYAIVKDEKGSIIKHKLNGLNNEIFREAFNGITMMIYEKNSSGIEHLEKQDILGTLPIK